MLDAPSKRNRPQDAIVKSRIARRNAQAAAGPRAFACAVPLPTRALAMGQAYAHREAGDGSHPGGRRV
jgi:hypothetical protein